METRTSWFLALLALYACAEPPGGSPDSAAPPPAEPGRLDLGGFAPRNVVVVNVDTLRADALPHWGGPHPTMPAMAARPGWVSIDRAVATAGWTAPSTASLLSGRDLPAHGVRYADHDGTVGTMRVGGYAELLREQGYATALFSGSSLLLEPSNGLATGFEDVEGVPFDLYASVSAQEEQIRGALSGADEPERAEILAAVRGVYDEQVLGVDRALEALIAGLERLGHGEDTLVVLTADHGESFFDGPPAMLGHGMTARDELLHVPLLFWGAGVQTAHVPCVASNMDVMPTVAELLGVNGPRVLDGRSLLTECRTRAFSGVYEAGPDGEVLTWLSVEGAQSQVVVDCTSGEKTAFDLATDPLAAEVRIVHDVPEGAELAGWLDGYRDEVLAALPHVWCGP